MSPLPPDNARMTLRQKRWAWAIGLFLTLAALSAATCWNVLSDPESVLAFNDGNIEGVLAPGRQFPQAFVRIWENQAFFGSGGKQYPIAVTAIGESLGPVFYRRTAEPILLSLCGLAIFWSLRKYRIKRPAAALTAAILVNTGWSETFAFLGLAVRPLALAFTFLAIGFAEQGRVSRRWLPYAIGGACLGLGVSEAADVGAILAMGAAFVFWWTHLSGVRSQKSEVRSQQPEPTGLRPALRSLGEGGSIAHPPALRPFRCLQRTSCLAND